MALKVYELGQGGSRRAHMAAWKKQTVDARDEAYRLKLHTAFTGAPSSVDLRPGCSPIEDQGELGSCTAHMFASLIEYNEIKRIGKVVAEKTAASLPTVKVAGVSVDSKGVVSYTTTVTPAVSPTPAPTPTPTPAPTPAPVLERVSRLLEYYATRKIEGTVNEDSGASIRDAIKAGNVYGVADENLWPYDITKFTQNPPQNAWTNAATHKVTSYHSIADGDLNTMKATLASGYLVGFGFQVYDYFMTSAMATQAILTPPKPTEQLQGGHAVALVGYDDNKAMPDGTKGAFLVRNSWSKDWGLDGYFYMSYSYVANTQLCSDFWVVVSAPV